MEILFSHLLDEEPEPSERKVYCLRSQSWEVQAKSVHISLGPKRTEDTDWIGSWPEIALSLTKTASCTVKITASDYTFLGGRQHCRETV